MTHVLIPIVALEQAKRRLQPALTPGERRALVLAMLQDVLETLRSVGGIAGIAVITPDAAVSRTARAMGAEVIKEAAATGLNAAAAIGIRHATRRRRRELMIVPGDVPLATAEEFSALVAASPSRERAAIVPSRDGQGTNALLLAPPDLVAPAFGPGSFKRHIARARAVSVAPAVPHLPGLGCDIDLPEDLACLWAAREQCPRYRFLSRLGRLAPADMVSPVRESA